MTQFDPSRCLLPYGAKCDTVCTVHLGAWLSKARDDAGVSYAEAAYRIRPLLPASLWVSLETIRRMERRENPDPVLAAALATVYGKAVDEWPEELRRDAGMIRATLTDTRSGSSVEQSLAVLAA